MEEKCILSYQVKLEFSYLLDKIHLIKKVLIIFLLRELICKTFDELVKYNFSNFRLVAIKKSKEYFGEIAIE